MGTDIFDVVGMDRLRALAQRANQVGMLGRCSVIVTGFYEVFFVFELTSCFEASLISANDEVYKKIKSCNDDSDDNPN